MDSLTQRRAGLCSRQVVQIILITPALGVCGAASKIGVARTIKTLSQRGGTRVSLLMTQVVAKLNTALARHVPALRVFVKGDAATRYYELSPVKQVLLGSLTFALTGWLLVSTSAIILSAFQSNSTQDQAQVLQQAYEARIAALTEERDISRAEADMARDRFSLALAEVSSLNSDMMTALNDSNQLSSQLNLLQSKYALAITARDNANVENQQLLAQNAALDGAATLGKSLDMSDTLQTISLALSETARERDAAETSAETFQTQIVGLQLKIKINAERQDRMMTRLEEAVTGSYAPLEGMFEAAGLDVGRIVGDVELSHSGTGGPLNPVLSTKGAFSLMAETPPSTNERFQDLLHDIDAVNSLQIAAVSLPFSNPVDGAYRFTSGFGGRNDPISGGRRQHEGLDFAGSKGTDIVATGDGEVYFAGPQSGYGNLIKIRHSNGYDTIYAHLSAIVVKVGDHVSRGDHIGDMGNTGRSTGTHLHYEIRLSGDPLNPMTFLEAARNVL